MKTVDEYIEKYRKLTNSYRGLQLDVNDDGSCAVRFHSRLHNPTAAPEEWGTTSSKVSLQVSGKTLLEAFQELDELYKAKHQEYIALYTEMLKSMKEEGLVNA